MSVGNKNVGRPSGRPLAIIDEIIPSVELHPFQNIGMRKVFLNKKMLLAMDTGLGKTFTYSGAVRGLINANPEGKHILVVTRDALGQISSDVKRLTEVSIETFDGTDETVGRLRFFWQRTTIFCLTYEALRLIPVVEYLYRHLMEIMSFSIDEAHHCSNWDSSDTAFMIRSLVKWIPYSIVLTATPITSESQQYYRLMNLLDRAVSHRRDETNSGKYLSRYYSVNRDDYGLKGEYKTTLLVVDPTLDQAVPQKGIVFKKIKGVGAVNQVNTLISTVQDRISKGQSVIIYIHYHDTRQWVEDNMCYHGINFVSLHGRILKRDVRDEILDSFRTGKVNVLLTSVTESLNIEADVVIFYEFTTSVKQVIGRAHRGLEGKELEVVFIITRDTDEVDFFLEYIYKRSVTIQRLLQKDYSELISIGERVLELQRDEE